uniref:Uncharacterized protein n=1 Tax=Micrurus lemniscatus lemniscatus TaxID=129467 RepID=A0A2D4HH39_MICLE
MLLLKSYCKLRANCNLLFVLVTGGHLVVFEYPSLSQPVHEICMLPSATSWRDVRALVFQDQARAKLCAYIHFLPFNLLSSCVTPFLKRVLLLFDNLVHLPPLLSGLTRSCIHTLSTILVCMYFYPPL